jgi:hypothetical protein
VAIDARVVALQTQAARDKAEAVRRVETEWRQQIGELRERNAAEFQAATDALRAQLRHAEQQVWFSQVMSRCGGWAGWRCCLRTERWMSVQGDPTSVRVE